MTGLPWDASYRNGPAPWDISGPQPAVARLAKAGAFEGAVLDAGCGTGENALYVARHAGPGVSVVGVDVAETALEQARAKAAERGLDAEFTFADAFALERLERSFRTVLDCGLFHTFTARERLGYVASLARVTANGGILYVLCFSDEGSVTGPHPVSRVEFAEAFGAHSGWEITALEAARVQANFLEDGAPGWLARIRRS